MSRRGRPNKKTELLHMELINLGVRVPEKIVELLTSNRPVSEGGLSDRDKLHGYLELLNYLYPKRKAVEFEVSESGESQKIIYEADWAKIQSDV